MNNTASIEAIRTLLAQAWREGVTAQSPEYAVNPYETTMHDARIAAALRRPPAEDDFGDASIGRAMAAARERGDGPPDYSSRLTVEGSPS